VNVDGFGIADEQYPPAEWYAKNVRLEKLDIFKPVLRGRYDVSFLVFLACFYFSLLLVVFYWHCVPIIFFSFACLNARLPESLYLPSSER